MATDPLSILVVSPWWATEALGGGVQTNVITLAAELSRNHRVSVFVPDWDERRLRTATVGAITVFRRRLRAPVEPSGITLRAFLGWLLDLPGTLRDLRQAFANQRVDVVHLHQFTPSLFTICLARIMGGPRYVVTFHGRDARDYHKRSPVNRWLIRQMLRKASGVTAVSQSLADLARGQIREMPAITVIRNGVSLARSGDAQPVEDPSHVVPGLPDRYFVSVGRLYPLKGHDLAIRAWGLLASRLPEVHLVIVGEGPQRADYENLKAECGCGDSVHLVGGLPHSLALRVMAGAVGLISVSRAEGGGPTMTILEAGASGLPVVVSDIPALAESIHDGENGLVVPSEEPAAIAHAVARLAGEPDLVRRLGDTLLHMVAAEFSAERMAEGYVDAYRRASRSGRP